MGQDWGMQGGGGGKPAVVFTGALVGGAKLVISGTGICNPTTGTVVQQVQ
jgi:hypothetical protein